MSHEARTAVWDKTLSHGSAKLLLLAIADFADADGLAWPGTEKLSRMAGVGQRAVSSLLARLEASGELYIERRRGRHHFYIVKLLGSEAYKRADRRLKAMLQTPDQEIGGGEEITPDQMIGSTPDQMIGRPLIKRSGDPLLDPSLDPTTTSAVTSGDEQRGQVFGFDIGSTVYVWSDKLRQDVPVTVIGSTPVFVILSWSDGARSKTLKRKPKHVFREPRQLETFEDLTPIQQVVGKWTRQLRPGEGVPGDTKAFINTVLKRLDIRFGTNGHAVTADELDQAWTRQKESGKIPTTDPDKIPGMINELREAAHPSQAVTNPLASAYLRADPHCPICKGNGTLLSSQGEVGCKCLDREVRRAG